jgi:hypothetical protein
VMLCALHARPREHTNLPPKKGAERNHHCTGMSLEKF